MNQKTTIPACKSPIIYIESLGEDLRIKGHDRAEIIIQTDDEAAQYEVEPQGAKLNNGEDAAEPDHEDSSGSSAGDSDDNKASDSSTTIRTTVKVRALAGDTVLNVPSDATLYIGAVGGDMQLRSVRGLVEIESVGEDLSATKIGALNIKSVGGDLSIKRSSGNISIDRVGEDVSCIDIDGDINLTAGGDVSIHDIRGNLTANVGEDALLRFAPLAGKQYSVIAGADIMSYLPDNTSAQVILRSGNRTLRVRGWEVPPPPEDELYTFTLGNGDATLNLNAGEDITLASQSADGQRAPWLDYDIDLDFGPGFQFRFDSDRGFNPEQFSNLFSEKIQSKVQNAMRQAEEQISNAISHAESRIASAEQRASEFESRWSGRDKGRRNQGKGGPERGQRRASRRGSDGHPGEDRRRRRHARGESPQATGSSPTPSAAQRSDSASQQAKAPVTEAERLMVLRMVEEGKISVEQAEKLLAAMGS